MSEQNNAINSLAHTKWNCKYHVVFAPKYRRKVFFNEKREDVREIVERGRNNRRRNMSGSCSFAT